MIRRELLAKQLVEVWKENQYDLPEDVTEALRRAAEAESDPLARAHFQINLESLERTRARAVPFCGDTGLCLYYVVLGERAIPHLEGGVATLFRELRSALARSTLLVPLRANAVDPLTRHNPNNNVGPGMPFIHHKIAPEADFLEICAVGQGGGAQGPMGRAVKVLWANAGWNSIVEFVQQLVVEASGSFCTPNVVGVGLGGTVDVAAALADAAATLRPIGERHPRPEIAKLEIELFAQLSKLRLGPWGLLGETTVLDVKVESAYTHNAILPVAVSLQCPALRRATVRFYPDGRFERDRRSSWFGFREVEYGEVSA